jgi:predicted transcriptional regulator
MSAKPKTRERKLKTTPVSVRVSDTHLAELARLIKKTGVQQSAHIQMAISEYLERRRA